MGWERKEGVDKSGRRMETGETTDWLNYEYVRINNVQSHPITIYNSANRQVVNDGDVREILQKVIFLNFWKQFNLLKSINYA